MKALESVNDAIEIIEIADARALTVDGPVGHIRDEMTDAEWRKMYLKLLQARRSLLEAVRDGEVN